MRTKIKLFEQYNREETLLGLAKMGLRTNRKEVFDLAVSRGLDIEKNKHILKEYAIENNIKSLWFVIGKEEYNKYFSENGEILDWDYFRTSKDGDPDLKYEYLDRLIYNHNYTYNNEDNQDVPSVDIEYFSEEDDYFYNSGLSIHLNSSHINATVETSDGHYYIDSELDDGSIDILIKFLKWKYPNLKPVF